MIVAFDTFFLARQFRNVGIYEYTKRLLQQFRGLAEEDGSFIFRYFISPGYSDDVLTSARGERCEPINTGLLRYHRMWRLGLGNLAAARSGADIIFTPSQNMIPAGNLPVVATIHDAIAVRLPSELVEASTKLRALTWLSAKLCRRIVTDSEHSKKDLVEVYRLPPEKVSVVYLGYDRNTFNSSPPAFDEQRSLLVRFRINGPYFLHHGMVQLRKNLPRLIKAYRILTSRRPELNLQLVLAGVLGLGSEEIRQLAEPDAGSGKIVFTGPLLNRELALLIKGASLCVIPSLYEGFCLPLVEAMACGTPTIGANSSCIPEVSGGVLRYFDPLSEEEMATVMEEVLDHPSIQRELADRGLSRASEFSWERCARETLAVLKAVSAEASVPRS